jgi:hypothetical protein
LQQRYYQILQTQAQAQSQTDTNSVINNNTNNSSSNSNNNMLSVTAEPFHPVHGTEINAVIYNDLGIPSFTFQGTDSEFLHSIADDAIDEAFPPSAQEAAELEAVETFVEMMATLSKMEEREEKTRFSDGGLGKKRWMARRELNGKPRPAKHSVYKVNHHNHHQGGRHPLDKEEKGTTDLLEVFGDKEGTLLLRDRRLRQREMSRMEKLVTASSNHKMSHNQHHQKKKPIQQPRKNS